MIKKLLVVDDDRPIIDIIAAFFRATDVQVFTSQHPIDALRIFDVERPQVVLSDLKLGAGMDGATMCGRIRQEVPKTLTIAMSGYISMFDVSYLRGSGFDDIIQKPFGRDVLMDLIDCCLKKRARWDLANGAVS